MLSVLHKVKGVWKRTMNILLNTKVKNVNLLVAVRQKRKNYLSVTKFRNYFSGGQYYQAQFHDNS